MNKPKSSLASKFLINKFWFIWLTRLEGGVSSEDLVSILGLFIIKSVILLLVLSKL